MWKIAIDTGGTFTDCIGTSPDGQTFRAKVLSSARLRGVITKKLGGNSFRFHQQWRMKLDIFKGYSFYLTGRETEGVIVESIDFHNSTISLNKNPFPEECNDSSIPESGVVFEITAHEEAPVLGARMLTLTPLHEPLPEIDMRLGSTKGTNALLEKKGARVTLIITKGLKDLIEIGTQQRPHLFMLNIPPAEILYSDVVEVNERITPEGKILHPLDESEIRRVVEEVRKSGAVSVAVALMHSWKNPKHEQEIGKALNEAGYNFISLSHALVPGIKILPRAQTALVDAYLEPVLNDYLHNIKATIFDSTADSVLRIMTSAGGLIHADHFRSKDSLLSGPAGGVVGAAAISQLLGFDKVLTIDMGGTSTDTARFDGHYDYEYFTKIGEINMLSPCLAIESVAAGGGSVCSFDGTRLTVGPESAGASPGPACYGAGGPMAITDVNLLLNKIDPSVMGIPLLRSESERALREIQQNVFEKTGLKYTEEELLRGFENIANEKMAEAIRRISVSKGFDPKDYALLVFGGAGGLHGCRLASLLGINTVILPYDAGLLSAYGIGEASVERFIQKQILSNLDNIIPTLGQIIHELSDQARSTLLQEGFAINETEIRSVFLYLRFKGQESSLEIRVFHPPSAEEIVLLEKKFETNYRELFGHYPTNRVVEVESIKVVAASLVKAGTAKPPAKFKPLLSSFNTGTYFWDELEVGSTVKGPAILINNTSTAYIEKGWTLKVDVGKNIVLKSDEGQIDKGIELSGSSLKKETNPIELELFTNRFTAIAEEMGAQLQRTAFSVNIKERLDFSCAILDPEAELLVNAPHIPVHLGSLGICTRLILEKYPLEPGDVIITNHPKYGGSHLPDVTLVMGVYSNENLPKLIGYVINRAHHAEIGGSRPGSMPPDARTLAEEGVVIPPTYLMKNGQVKWEALENLLTKSSYPTRALHENLADINAALAALKTGEEKLRSLVNTHGFDKVRRYMNRLKETAANALKEALIPFGNRSFIASDQLDDGHVIRGEVRLTHHPGEKLLVFDFRGSSEVHPFNLNANVSIVYSAVLYVLRILCNREIPLNEGLMKHVSIVLPESSFLHPQFSDNPNTCPAVVGGNTEVSQRIVDTLLKALEPITNVACSQGTMNNFLFGNDKFGYYETIGGGTGAGLGFHGRSAVHQHMTNTKITDPEELEFRYPVRLNRFAIRAGSGGEGRWRGGNGIVREMEFLEEVDMTLISQHRSEKPYGINGGENGSAGIQRVIRKNGTIDTLKGVDSARLLPGDRVIIETPGGGGAGRVLRD